MKTLKAALLALVLTLAFASSVMADGGSIPLCPPGSKMTGTPPTCKHDGMQ